MASTKVLGRLSSRMQPLSNKLNKKNANATVSSLLSPIKSASPAAITRLNRSSRYFNAFMTTSHLLTTRFQEDRHERGVHVSIFSSLMESKVSEFELSA